MLLSGSYEIHYCLLYLIGSRSFLKKKKTKKSVKEVKKEPLESIFKERSEDLELLINPSRCIRVREAI